MLKKKNLVDRIKNFMLSPKGVKQVPYKTGTRLIWWFCGTEYARTKYFRKKVNIFKTYLAETGSAEADPYMFREILSTFFIKKWRVPSFSNLSEKSFNKYVQVNNLHLLEESFEKGKGVVMVNSHYGLAEMALSIFPRLGYDFHTIVGTQGADSEKFTAINPGIVTKTITFDDFSDAELFKVMMQAKHVLKEGAIVHLLGDGYHGKSTLTLPFINKLRGFKGSYAELALSTDADIIPVFTYPDKSSKVVVDIYPALDKGNENDTREERVQRIVKQYVSLLAGKWESTPQFINLGHIEKYMHHVDEGQ